MYVVMTPGTLWYGYYRVRVHVYTFTLHLGM